MGVLGLWQLTQLCLTWLQLGPVVSGCENLSRNKQATQSSTLFYNNIYWNAVLALDGVTDYSDQRPTCSGTFPGNVTWWQLDLGAVLALNRIEVFGRPRTPPYQLLGFQVYVSNDPKNRTVRSLVYYNDMHPNQYNKFNGHFIIDINTTFAQYVTIELDRRKVAETGAILGAPPLLVLCEVRISKFCPEFSYDENCLKCGYCKDNETCDQTSGHCVQCTAGYMAPFCKKECKSGYYGDCTHACGRCKSGDVCHFKTGVCPNGCDKGYRATPKCDKECEDHYYDYNCTQSCGKCSQNDPCNKTDGHCLQCEQGFTGSLCKNNEDESKAGMARSTRTIVVSSVVAVVVTTVILVVVVIVMRRRRLQMNKNQRAAEDNANAYENVDPATDQTAGYTQLSQLRKDTTYSHLGESQQTKGAAQVHS